MATACQWSVDDIDRLSSALFFHHIVREGCAQTFIRNFKRLNGNNHHTINKHSTVCACARARAYALYKCTYFLVFFFFSKTKPERPIYSELCSKILIENVFHRKNFVIFIMNSVVVVVLVVYGQQKHLRNVNGLRSIFVVVCSRSTITTTSTLQFTISQPHHIMYIAQNLELKPKMQPLKLKI